MAAGRFEEAIPIYRELVAAVPGNSGLLLNLGMAEALAGHPRAAIPHLESVVKDQPISIPAWSTLAEADLDTRRFSEAATAFSKLSALDSANPRAWYGLGKANEELANASFARLSRSAPQSPYVAALLAETRLQQAQYRSAFFFYHQASTELPQLPGLHAGLARLYRSTAHPDWAAKEDSLEKDAANSACRSTQAPACSFARGHYAGTARQATSAGTPEMLFWSARSRNELARAAFAHLGELPESVELHAVKAEILAGHGQHAEAAKEWDTALALEPGNSQLAAERARSLFLAHDYTAALPLLKQQLSRDPAAPALNFMIGESLARSEQPAEALPYLNTALQNDSGMLPADASLGMALATLNRPAEAIPHLEKAQTLDEDGSLHYSLARAYLAAGRRPEAERTMRTYNEIKRKNEAINSQLAREAEITAPSR